MCIFHVIKLHIGVSNTICYTDYSNQEATLIANMVEPLGQYSKTGSRLQPCGEASSVCIMATGKLCCVLVWLYICCMLSN